MGLLDEMKLARKHSEFTRALGVFAKKGEKLREHDKDCAGC